MVRIVFVRKVYGCFVMYVRVYNGLFVLSVDKFANWVCYQFVGVT